MVTKNMSIEGLTRLDLVPADGGGTTIGASENGMLCYYADVEARLATQAQSAPTAGEAEVPAYRTQQIEHALRQIIDADDAQALSSQMVEVGRAALALPRAAEVPAGWQVRKDADGVIVVQNPKRGGCALGGKYNEPDNIEHTIFYAFLDAMLAAAPLPPAPAPVERAELTDERALFEAWISKEMPDLLPLSRNFDDYQRVGTQMAWAAWQHRASQPRPTDDHLWDETLRDRDTYHEWADKLAEAIAKHFDVDIGEHSNMNCPWTEALDVIESATPAASDQARNEWISVDERLPVFNFKAHRVSLFIHVIATLIDGSVRAMIYGANGWNEEESKPTWSFADGGHCDSHLVTHWMPLPAAPGDQAQGEKGGEHAGD